VVRVPILSPVLGRLRRRPQPAVREAPTATQPPRGARLDTKSSHAGAGGICGSSTFINNWASAVEVEVARTAAQGSISFVVISMAAETAAIVAVMLVTSAMHRNVASPWTRAVSTWVAAAGMLAPALVPNRLTLFAGFIALGWMGQAVVTLRNVVSDAPGDRPADGQRRVQTWIYRVLLGFQLGYVALVSVTSSWRYANVVVAAVLVVEGLYLVVRREMRQADPKTVHLPGSDQPLRSIRRYRPVWWAVLSVTASWVVSGLFFARAQSELTTLGWSAADASWIVVAVGATRALTLRRRPTGEANDELAERQAHHGRALIVSSAIMALSAVLLAATLFPAGVVTATVALVAAGVLSQFAMNRSNPIVREYIAKRSIDASNLLNLGGMLGVLVGGLLPAFMSWPWLVTTWGAVAVVMLGIAGATMGHRYESHTWLPRVPQTTVYELGGQWVGLHLRFELRPGGRAPLPNGFDLVPAYEAGLGVEVRLTAPVNAGMERQYWPARPFFTILSTPLTFDQWMRHQDRRTLGRAQFVVPAAEPALEMTAEPDQFLRQAQNGEWFLDLGSVFPRVAVLVEGNGPAPFLADDGWVHAVIHPDGLQRWELMATLDLPPGVYPGGALADDERWASLTADGRHQVYLEPADGGRPARWVVPASALALRRTVFTRIHGNFPEGTLGAWPYHY
jgi:hypothetical protein